MNPSRAKETVAAYLAGARRVAADELQRAHATLAARRAGRRYLRWLRGRIGLKPPAPGAAMFGLCQVFRSRAAEFCDLPAEERQSEFPQLVAHLEQCPACRRVLREIKPIWETVTTAWRTLAEPIRLRLAWEPRTSLEEVGLGVPAEEPSRVAAPCAYPGGVPMAHELAPAAEGAAAALRKEWVLQDDETHCAIRLTVQIASASEVTFFCRIEGEPEVTPRADQVRLEVLNRNSKQVLLAGRLSDFESSPPVLPVGSWLIRLMPREPERFRGWEIPLDMATDRPGPRT
jgi:hypothetical protein